MLQVWHHHIGLTEDPLALTEAEYTPVAGSYRFARFYDHLIGPLLKSIRRDVAGIILSGNFRSVLDVCCGTGDQLTYLKNTGIHAVGVDLSGPMLRISGSGRNPVNCLKQDAVQMDFPDGKFDLSMITLALHEKTWDTSGKILQEMIRVTAPSGSLILTDFDFSNRPGWPSRMLISAIEALAGGEHYEHFRVFIRNGGIPELVKDMPLKEVYCRYHGLRSLAVRAFQIEII